MRIKPPPVRPDKPPVGPLEVQAAPQAQGQPGRVIPESQPEDKRRSKICQVPNHVPMEPQVGLSVTARIEEVLSEESGQRGTRAKVDDRPRHPGEAQACPPEGQIEDDVLAVVQPFRVTTGDLPGP